MTWQPEEGQPAPGRTLAILAAVLALALALAGAVGLYVELAARSGSPLPRWLSPVGLAWLSARGPLVLAAGSAVLGVLGMLTVRATRRPVAPPPLADTLTDERLERLRRQLEPLATGDLAIWLPDAEGVQGEISRTLNLLVGGVSDLVAVADEASVQLLGAVQDGRGGLAGLHAEADRTRQLADEILDRARQAVAAARALGGRTRSKEPPAKSAAAHPGRQGTEDPGGHASLTARLEVIAEVVSDLAEQARVLAVGISVQAAARDAPTVLRAVGDDVALLAEQAGRAVGQVGPLVQAALEESLSRPLELHPTSGSDRIAGGSAAGRRVADQVVALAEVAASLRASADRLARVPDEAATSLAALADLAHRLRRVTGRFRLPD